jgi:hypothetical protein
MEQEVYSRITQSDADRNKRSLCKDGVTIVGWTVAVVSRGKAPGTTVRELFDCAIASHSEAEDAVSRAVLAPDTLLVASTSPLTDLEVRDLGLAPGELRKRK